MDARSGAYQMVDGEEVLTLVGVARLLPTLLASDSRSPGPDASRGGSPKLTAVLPSLMAATHGRCRDGPGRASQFERLSLSSLIKRALRREGIEGATLRDLLKSTGGELNPPWAEWFMGWPIGATALPPSATAKCHFKPPSPGISSGDHET
jgi:hypothetical protein